MSKSMVWFLNVSNVGIFDYKNIFEISKVEKCWIEISRFWKSKNVGLNFLASQCRIMVDLIVKNLNVVKWFSGVLGFKISKNVEFTFKLYVEKWRVKFLKFQILANNLMYFWDFECWQMLDWIFLIWNVENIANNIRESECR